MSVASLPIVTAPSASWAPPTVPLAMAAPSRLVNAAPLPVKVPVRLTAEAPLVSTADGSCPSASVPKMLVAETEFALAAVVALAAVAA